MPYLCCCHRHSPAAKIPVTEQVGAQACRNMSPLGQPGQARVEAQKDYCLGQSQSAPTLGSGQSLLKEPTQPMPTCSGFPPSALTSTGDSPSPAFLSSPVLLSGSSPRPKCKKSSAQRWRCHLKVCQVSPTPPSPIPGNTIPFGDLPPIDTTLQTGDSLQTTRLPSTPLFKPATRYQ